MAIELENVILKATGATQCRDASILQSLWSGYGSILRYKLEGPKQTSVIVKHVAPPPTSVEHPRGWNTNRSHLRKLKSYQVESIWYQSYAKRCHAECRIPESYAVEQKGSEVVLILEDLDTQGFNGRRNSVNQTEARACLKWLANFHATFLGSPTEGLWKSGTYWHLETRPDELEQLASEDPELYKAAKAIDTKLKTSPFQTLVHGDAKLANFCFTPGGEAVAAVDFQYVGGGCGMKDVAYFIGSCYKEEECEQETPALLDYYFNALRTALRQHKVAVDYNSLEVNWRDLYPVAWCDFHRFIKGWNPGHWKIHSYSEKLAKEVLAQI